MQQTKYRFINYLHLLGLVFLKTIAKPLHLTNIYNIERARHIKKTGLFDAKYYLSENKDVAESGLDPLLHYVIYGDKEGRKPSILFDPKFYKDNAKKLKFKFIQVNTLLHYYAVGRYNNISPSQWFNITYYLNNNRDVKLNGIEPLTHYLNYGGLEGRSPNIHFDSQFYLISNPDVKESGINPLVHYSLYGQSEGRKTSSTNEPAPDHPDPSHLTINNQVITVDKIKPVVRANDPFLIDVIIPVYENSNLTLLCIASVLQAKNNVSFELIVINDNSPNEKINNDLSIMAQKKWFTLINNEQNKGFVNSVNTGIKLHPKRDIIILNSDTEVYDFWLDRLCEVAYARPNVASVTPLSNNATICSYPRFLYENPYPLEITYAELDSIASVVNQGISVEAPSGVGFCMFMRRAVIDQIGVFDEETFGKGYGEENDWCQRALNAGKLNLLAPNIFVRHFGSASFKGEKNKRVSQAIDKLSERYPNYKRDIQTFIKMDAMSPARKRLDWARLERHKGKENIIFICHQRGGGTERHLQETVNKMSAIGVNVFFIRPGIGDHSHIQVKHYHCTELINISNIALSDHMQVISIIERLNVSEIHVHSLVDFEPAASTHLTTICKEFNIPLHISIHDYSTLCPRINLINENGMYCGEPDEKTCNQCLSKRGNDFGINNISIWRKNNYEMLSCAQSIVVPNADCSERVNKYFPDLSINIQPHHSEILNKINCFKSPSKSPKLRIVVIGAIGQMKGFDILLACATEAKNKKLPLEFILMGYSMNDIALRQQDVVIIGKYDDTKAVDCLLDINPDLVWLPSTWPETFSYTLSIALSAGFQVAAFDIGAIANRLRALEIDQHLMPFELANQPNNLNQKFLNYLESQYVGQS